ncbi:MULTISPECIES: septal ring lytic transglycosylase RlpA family protein [Pseudoalteromonas]|uniref:Endolytic peptidoglycan transglycosylase RlpA n=1 Tax=Pseudoalteromonas amylolytica TaxID=1859457 RepID=A0A1S1MVJ5_9GAMM|nr:MULTISPECIES: septal ring lytic transglycosylase RlpA family protein [Pseudoalteromonas]OHU90589.1 hypothetical protein BFC16_03000 [Pseudoalteromonas sp. JW3]OHU92790.1 hypothetical protein BET10_04895 [Pseudoalteromonas amylolytica]
MYVKLLALAASTTLLLGCSSIAMKSKESSIGYTQRGKASFYAMKYQFRKTASGERFNQLAKTAAHRTLPFGSKVRVTNVSNGKSTIVKVNDRGPFIKGRIIDLSRSAFSDIADTSVGVIEVEIEVIR